MRLSSLWDYAVFVVVVRLSSLWDCAVFVVVVVVRLSSKKHALHFLIFASNCMDLIT